MFRRLRLPGKLTLAAVPLVLALVAASALLVESTFADAAGEQRTADLTGVLVDLRAVVDAIAAEEAPFAGPVQVTTTGDDAARQATDERIDRLRASIEAIGAPPLARQLTVAVRRLDDVRATVDDGTADGSDGRVPAAYEQVATDMLAVATLIPAEISNPVSARALEGVAAIARARQVAAVQNRIVTSELQSTASLTGTVDRIRELNLEFIGLVNIFETVASSDARTIFARSGAPVAVGAASSQIDLLLDSPFEGLRITVGDWNSLLGARADSLSTFETELTATIGDQAVAAAAAASRSAWIVVATAAGAILLAAILTWAVSRSIVRRVRSVTDRAQHVAQEQLPALVEALRDPSEETLPTMPPIRDRGADEIGDLARSFAAMQSTLEHVAEQQMETLRKGVADMFVTLARRNRSLVDRQLALIDELESGEEDPHALAEYYRLDHMATRMRRNAESLLVLAGTEPARSWRTPLTVDDVVRAAIGEIEDYRRVDVLTLETVQLQGTVVADVSHLLSELLENATNFSPPETRVRISGHFHEQGYLVTITDRGVGIPEARLTELNRLLDRPPVVGLALEPTLGLYVVAMLARRHGIQVRLVPGAPGVSAKLLIPPSVYDTTPLIPVTEPVTTAEPRPGPHPDRPPTSERRPPEPRPVVEPVARRHQERPAPAPAASRPHPPGDLPTRAPAEPVVRARHLDPAQGSEPGLNGSLPTRNPGANFAADPASERPLGAGHRSPESVRSTFGAFQTGVEAGRRDADTHEGDVS